jgi:hypothetical protein
MKRSAPIILAVSMVVGVAGGLLYTWVLDPIEYYDSPPDALRTQDKFVYLVVIGDLYALEEDLPRAEARLAELGVEADGPVLAGLIEQYLDGGGQAEEVRNLARLAEALGASGGVLLVFAAAPTPSPEPTVTLPSQPSSQQPETPLTPAPTVTPAPSFHLAEQTAVCAEPGQPGAIVVRVRDEAGNGLAGIGVVVSWSTGQDRFFTGLRPELGAGYADFEMQPDVEYEVALVGFSGETAQGLSADLTPGLCPTGTIALDWQLSFERGQ